MNRKYISIGLLALIALAFLLLFRRGCGSRETQNLKPETVVVPAVDNPPVVAPQFPTADVPDQNSSPYVQRELEHYKGRYSHYKSEWEKRGERLAVLDSLLAADALTCDERVALLRRKLAEQEGGLADGGALIDELNEELAPRRDTGSAETPDYRFRWQFDHFGRMLPNGFVYDIDLKERKVQCPDCPPPKRPLRRNLSAFYGMGLDGRQRYAVEARRQWRRVSVSGLVMYDGAASGLVGLGWSW